MAHQHVLSNRFTPASVTKKQQYLPTSASPMMQQQQGQQGRFETFYGSTRMSKQPFLNWNVQNSQMADPSIAGVSGVPSYFQNLPRMNPLAAVPNASYSGIVSGVKFPTSWDVRGAPPAVYEMINKMTADDLRNLQGNQYINSRAMNALLYRKLTMAAFRAQSSPALASVSATGEPPRVSSQNPQPFRLQY